MSSPSDRRKPVPDASRTRDPERLGDVLDGLLEERTWRSGLALGDLARRWPEVVGQRLADESRPGRLDDGVLTVVVSSSAWGTQIGFLQDDIVRRTNDVLGGPTVRSIRVMVDADAASGDGGSARHVGGHG